MRTLPPPARSKASPLAVGALAAAALFGCGKKPTPPAPLAPSVATGESAVPSARAASVSSAGVAAPSASTSTGPPVPCGHHGSGVVWRLSGMLGGKPVTGDAIVINGTLRLALETTKPSAFGYFKGAIDASGRFALQPGPGEKAQTITAVSGTLGESGKLAAKLTVADKSFNVALTGAAEPPATAPRLTKAYAVTTLLEGGDSVESPVGYRSVAHAVLLSGVAPGVISVVAEGGNSAHGGCSPGELHDFGKEQATRVKLVDVAKRLVAPASVVTSEVFQGMCERAWYRAEWMLLVEHEGKKEIVTVGSQDDSVESMEIQAREPWPPVGCR